MVDVISTRIQEACINWGQNFFENNGNQEKAGGQRPHLASSGVIGFNLRRRQNFEKESIKFLRENNLYQIKEVPSKATVVPPQPRPFMGLSCNQCTPSSRDSLKKDKSNLINVLHAGSLAYLKKGFFSRNYFDIVETLKCKDFDYKQLSSKVLNDEQLKQAIEQVTQNTLVRQEYKDSDTKVNTLTHDDIYKTEEKRARKIVMELRSTISNVLLKLTSWTLHKLLPYFITSIAVSPTQMNMLKTASDSGIPLIFIPLHRSHLDYILVSFILVNNNIKSPLVAAGDNLRIPFFGWLLRGLGAFYIKRRLEVSSSGEKDLIYRAALHTYIMHALRAHNNIEFFIEGGRSRTGKPVLPKGGILSVIIDAYLDETVEDALLIPVSMNYDKIVDGNFVREQTGMPKQMETFSGAIKSIWSVLRSHYGNIRVDFNQPFSLRELVRTFQQQPSKLSPPPFLKNASKQKFDGNGAITIEKLAMERKLSSRSSCSSLYGTDVAVEEQRTLVEAIARHVVYDCTHATTVMSTNAIAYLLLSKFRQGCTMDELSKGVDVLVNELSSSNKDVGFSGKTEDVINHAIRLLGPELIVKEKRNDEFIIKPILKQPNIIELSYYGNCLLPHFAMQSIIATALQVIITGFKTSIVGLEIRHNELVDMAMQLSEILSQEFILHKPCQKLKDIINESIENLAYKEIIKIVQETYTEDQRWSRRFAKTLDDEADDDYNITCAVYNVSIDSAAIKTRIQLQTAIRPLIDTYCITASCLPRLLAVKGDYITENEFTKIVLSVVKDELENGTTEYGEALSLDTIKNCIRLFRQWGVIDSYIEGRDRYLCISKYYANEIKLNKISELVYKFRTEIPKEVKF